MKILSKIQISIFYFYHVLHESSILYKQSFFHGVTFARVSNFHELSICHGVVNFVHDINFARKQFCMSSNFFTNHKFCMSVNFALILFCTRIYFCNSGDFFTLGNFYMAHFCKTKIKLGQLNLLK